MFYQSLLCVYCSVYWVFTVCLLCVYCWLLQPQRCALWLLSKKRKKRNANGKNKPFFASVEAKCPLGKPDDWISCRKKLLDSTMVIFVSCFNTSVSRHAKHLQMCNVLDTWASMWTWCLSLARRRHVPRHQRTHIVPCAHAPFSNWHSECRTYVRHTHTLDTPAAPLEAAKRKH